MSLNKSLVLYSCPVLPHPDTDCRHGIDDRDALYLLKEMSKDKQFSVKLSLSMHLKIKITIVLKHITHIHIHIHISPYVWERQK